jgi:hypothetical protein
VLPVVLLPPISTVVLWSAAAVGPITTMPTLTLLTALLWRTSPLLPPLGPVAVAEVVGAVAECVALA